MAEVRQEVQSFSTQETVCSFCSRRSAQAKQTLVVDMNVFQVGNNSRCIVQGHLSNTPFTHLYQTTEKKDRPRLMDFEFSELGEVNQALCGISGSFSGVLPRPRSEPGFVRAPNSVGQARTCGTRSASFG